MKAVNYQTPVMNAVQVDSEGILCSSPGVGGGNALELPDVTWKDETEW